jgi:hypothetical protein
LIWSQLRDLPAWQLLKEEVIKELAAAPAITDQDSKEAFLYQSIKAKELLKFLNTPEDRIELIEQTIQNKPQ